MVNFLKKIQIELMKILINTVGRLSDGIVLANEEGFISGKMIDYVYENKAGGKFIIGKLIDRIYLSHPGWEGIRTRKKYLIEDLSKAIEATLKNKNTVRICDVASGPAKYILETLEKYKNGSVSAEIRDLDERWLVDAVNKAKELNLNLEYKVANALEESDFVFEKKPDIFVASGFYDWFEDDELIKKSMRLIFNTLEKGGFFVFTNQAGHADLVMTNAVFKDFNLKELKMTVRPQELINSWAKDAGFTVIETKIDKYKYYSNTLAVK